MLQVLCAYIMASNLVLYEIPENSKEWVPVYISVSCAFSLTLSFCLCLLSYSDMLAFVIFYLIVIPSKSICFLIETQKGVDPIGGEVGRHWKSVGREIVIQVII